jgi:hypothetical protein
MKPTLKHILWPTALPHPLKNMKTKDYRKIDSTQRRCLK